MVVLMSKLRVGWGRSLIRTKYKNQRNCSLMFDLTSKGFLKRENIEDIIRLNERNVWIDA